MSSNYPAPASNPQYGQIPMPQQQRSNKKVVWIITGIIAGLLLLFTVFVGGILAVVFGSIRSSDPYRFAVETATHDPRVLAELGSPVKPGWFVNGSININGNSGEADLSIPVQGSMHKGKIYVVAKKSEGIWTYQKLVLRVDDSSLRLDLLPHNVTHEEN